MNVSSTAEFPSGRTVFSRLMGYIVNEGVKTPQFIIRAFNLQLILKNVLDKDTDVKSD